MRGLASLGALKYLETRTELCKFHTFIGSSIGSVICSFLNIKVPIDEIYTFFLSLNPENVAKFHISKITTQFGLDSGINFVWLVKQVLVKHGYDENVTFADLFEKTEKKLVITGTNVNTHSIEYFDYESSPRLRIVDAIRISISVPFIFTAPLYKGCYYVDGGVLDNFPLHLTNNENHKEVLAIKLGHTKHIHPINNCVQNLEDFSMNLLQTMLDEIEYLRNKECTQILNDSQILHIDTKDYSSFTFNLQLAQKQELFKMGYDAAAAFHREPKEPEETQNGESVIDSPVIDSPVIDSESDDGSKLPT